MKKKPSRSKAIDPIALFKILSDHNRFKAITHLSENRTGLLVGDLAELLNIGPSATSHLLAFLNDHGIVIYRKEGRTVRYLLDKTPTALALLRIKRAA
jgi:DNA-binding transcriptional ArsR family regulator